MSGGFSVNVRVRLSETDALGVVYYGQYLTYFDLARLEMLRKAGVTLQFLEARKLGFVAAESSCRYRSSAKFDDVLVLRVRVAKIGRTSVTYEHEILQGKKKVATGKVVDVLVGSDKKPSEIPSSLRSKLEKFC